MDNLIEATSCILFPKLGTGDGFDSCIHGIAKHFLRSRTGEVLSECGLSGNNREGLGFVKQ
jgi:hypothetical protein